MNALELAEQLEAIGLHGPVAAELRRLAAVEAQRDALLEALKRYVDHFGDPLKCARAAIKKAEEA